MIDKDIIEQLTPYLDYIENDVVLNISAKKGDKDSDNILEFANAIASLSNKITIEETALDLTPSLNISRLGAKEGRVVFAGTPLGHELTSFIMALVQVSGRPPKIDGDLIEKIKKIDKKLDFVSYINLVCHNCPEVVQALNIMAVLNPNITSTSIDGNVFIETVEARNIMAVPTVYCNDVMFASGRLEIKQILDKLGLGMDKDKLSQKEPYDVLVVGAGPAGAAAAIYAARKGIRTGIIGENIGGQVLDTLHIENIIGTKRTEGAKFMAQVKEHIEEYPIDIISPVSVSGLEKKDLIELTLANDAVLKSKTVIIATGAKWRNLGIMGENDYKNRGLAVCPHCDGPLFAGKKVAVIGGGNSGVEAAIDLSVIVEHVTLLEYASELKADKVLQNKLASLSNVTIVTNAKTKEIKGSGKVEALVYTDLQTDEDITIDVAGIFVLIGLVPNTGFLKNIVNKTRIGEIVVDKSGMTSMPGVFAAGDCTDSAYKQIIISMGSGATAALGAFDYLMRN